MSKIPSSLNQKSYLQKYLGGPSGDKKKKKKKAVKGTGLKIIDDDIDLSKLRTLDGDELDVFDQGEDAPQIAGIIDDRPEEVKKAEQFSSSSKWKIINQDDGFNSKLEVEEIKSDVKQAEKENEYIFGKMYSDSEDDKKNDSDLSPPRKQDNDNKAKTSKSSKKHDSDSDFSPPRKRDARSPNRKNDDRSPKRKNDDRSPKRRDDRSKNNHNDKSPNERHDNSARRRDDRSPKKRGDPKTKSVETSTKRRDDRSPNERHEKSSKRKNDRSPDQRQDKSTKRSDDKRKHDDRSPKKRNHERSPKRKSRDRSPKRKNDDKSPKRRDDDRSPVKEKSNRNDTDIPPKRERPRKPSRWGHFGPEDPATLQPSTSEHSPRTADAGNSSPPTRTRTVSSPRHSKNYDSDASPPRKSKKNYDSDQSPPRKSKKSHDSPPRKSRKDQASDLSPPRRSKGDSSKRNRSPGFLSPSKKPRFSPERHSHNDRHERYQSNSKQDKSRKHRHSPDSDLSPPRRNRNDKSASPPRKNRKAPENNKRRTHSDSDQSPPRREKDRNTSERDRSKRAKDSPPPSNKKMAKTLEGKLAGLQDARQLRHENESFRKREEEVYNKMTDEVSGRNAQVVSRKSKRETSEEKQKLKEKAERQKELDEKYKKWSKGIKQLEDQEARVQEFMHESSKPLARLRDDRDLEDNLKQVERDGDPMLKYMRDRKRERGELGPEKPKYKGQFPPNRFNIRPGYRWDGVDRSNGYENKYFDQQSKRKAQEEEAYKWSTEDL